MEVRALRTQGETASHLMGPLPRCFCNLAADSQQPTSPGDDTTVNRGPYFLSTSCKGSKPSRNESSFVLPLKKC